jgi:putative inorganic carbon (HCO3(-)) transporter
MKKKEITPFDWVQLAVLLLVSPLFVFPRERFAWIFLVIPLLWVVRKIIGKRFLERTLLDIPILIILVQVLLTTLFAANPSHSFPKVAGLLLAIGLFYAVIALLKTEKLLKVGVILFLGGGFLFSLLGLVGMSTFRVKHLTLLMKIKEALPRIDFNLPGAEMGFSPNAVGGILLLIIPLFMTMLYSYLPEKIKPLKSGCVPFIKGKRFPLFLVLGLAVTSGVLLLTQSRGAWVGLALAFMILFFFSLRKRKSVLITIIIVLLVVSFILVPSLLKVDQVQLTTKQAEGTLLFRVQMWDQALPRIYAHPFLGIGLNEFRYLPEIKYNVSHAHNKFFHVAVELGIPALIAYLALLLLTAFMILKTWQSKNTGTGWQKIVILGLGCGQLAHVIFELTDVIPFGAKVGIFPWISLALITAIYNYFIKVYEVPKVS